MKPLLCLLAVMSLTACPAVPKKAPRVDTAPVGRSFDKIGVTADELDALALDLERRGQ